MDQSTLCVLCMYINTTITYANTYMYVHSVYYSSICVYVLLTLEEERAIEGLYTG